jgi:hypothetical protein
VKSALGGQAGCLRACQGAGTLRHVRAAESALLPTGAMQRGVIIIIKLPN